MHGFDVGDLERRLVRAEISAAAIPWADRKLARHRASLRVQVSLCDLIRQRLQAMGIDPKCAIALRRGERAAAELAGIPDTPELRASDAAPPTGPNSSEAKDRLDREIAQVADSMVERFARGEEPVDLANASLVELLAFVTAFGPAAQMA